MQTTMRYHEMPVDTRLGSSLACYWEFADLRSEGGPYDHQLMPDASVSITYARWTNGDRRLMVTGPRIESMFVQVLPGQVCWGLRIWPGASRCLLDRNGKQLLGANENLASFHPQLGSGLCQVLDGCQSAQDARAALDKYLVAHPPRVEQLDELVVAAVSAISATDGQISIARLAQQFNLTARQFQRRFGRSVGMTPKQFARVQRFRSSTVRMVDGRASTWAEAAAAGGYTDQSHLIRDFCALVGFRPGEFQRRLKRIQHGHVDP